MKRIYRLLIIGIATVSMLTAQSPTAPLELSVSFAGQGEPKRLRVYGALGPTVTNMYRPFSVGINYQTAIIPFSIGIDLMQTQWYASEVYEIEKGWLMPDQAVGNAVDLLNHSTYGFALNVGTEIGDQSSLWSGTTVQAGIQWAYTINPHAYFLVDYFDEEDPKRTGHTVPFIRLMRSITPKLPLIVTGQIHYVPSAGFVSQFMIGVKFGFLK